MLIGALVLIYIGVAAFAYFAADRLIFLPHAPSYRAGPPYITLTTRDGVKITALHLVNPSAKFTLLSSHGNAEDLGDLMPFYEDLRRLGFSVMAYDYHGYGTSGGTPSEANAYADEDAAYDYLLSQGVTPDRIIAHGRSLGGGMAVEVAQRRPVAGLIVESSFVTAFRVMTHIPILPFDEFPSLARIKRVSCPVLIIHGTADEVIGFWHGEKLFAAANGPKSKLWVEGAGHNDLFDVAGAKYGAALQAFAASLGR